MKEVMKEAHKHATALMDWANEDNKNRMSIVIVTEQTPDADGLLTLGGTTEQCVEAFYDILLDEKNPLNGILRKAMARIIERNRKEEKK